MTTTAAFLGAARIVRAWLCLLDDMQEELITPEQYSAAVAELEAGTLDQSTADAVPSATLWTCLLMAEQAGQALGVDRRSVIDNVCAEIERQNQP